MVAVAMAVDLLRGVNLGPDHNIGTDIANKVTVNVDDVTIVRDPGTGVLSAPRGVLEVVGWLSVNADGTTAASAGGATATLTAVGLYDVVPPAGTVVAAPTVFEAENTRDAISIHFTDATFTRLWIGESDNGGSAAPTRNRAWVCTFLAP